MKTIRMIALAAAMTAAVACGNNGTDNQMPKESIDSVSYLLGVNAGMLINSTECFDEFADMNVDKFVAGTQDGFNNGGPSNPYMMDTVWAKKFQMNPYDIGKVINGINVRRQNDTLAIEVSKASIDSASYLIGVNNGVTINSTKCFDEFADVNMDLVKAGVEDVFAYGQPSNPYVKDTVWAEKFKVSPYEMNKAITRYAEGRQYEKERTAFFNENKKNAGVKETKSGLQYIIHEEGEGDKVAPEDEVLVNYKGTLLDGTQFDANDSIQFAANRVIKGWTEGLGLLGKGGKATLYIPSKLGYGQRGAGYMIKPNSILVFEVEVLDIIKPQAPVEVAE